MSELQMLTQDEVATLLHVHKDTIVMLREVGVIKSIKTGKNYMFSQESIRRFQQDYEGYDVSNRANAIYSKTLVDAKKAEN